jgi:hypothetical protein
MHSSIDVSQSRKGIGRLGAVSTLLEVICEISGMRLAMVAHVEGKVRTVCAVRDELQIGTPVGS